MIGGSDIVIPWDDDPASRLILLEAVRKYWPHSLFVGEYSTDGNASSPIPIQNVKPRDLPSEFFIYKDIATYKSWCIEGYTELASERMIHFILTSEAVTCIVDGTEIVTLVEFLIASLA